MSDALVYYALSLSGRPHEGRLLHQLLKSIASLRAHNRSLGVRLHLCGALPPPVALYLGQALGVEMLACGSYPELLEASRPGSAASLADFPFLAKMLTMRWLPAVEQVLYVDSDTYFFADPASLFAHCRAADLYAREEPFSPGSPAGYRPEVIDVERLAALARDEGAAYVSPFNTGVMLLNHRLWERLSPLLPRFMDLMLRFTPPPEAAQEVSDAYPAGTRYIRDQVAFWLLTGLVPGFTPARLQPDQLSQGLKELVQRGRQAPPLLGHYFGINTEGFFEWLAR